MRDPERIPKVLEQLRGAWEKNPDLRLGQMVANGVWEATGSPCNLFYVEDEELVWHIVKVHGKEGG